ncbi:glutathione S-transferase 1-1-like [Hyposmocoma kahamanoa]|uniref:glutathione S-transferase 1-1-like n=1 Tax=Hyposmocoma kahamanoa TaxID=1477025 RepID=UPI000E6D9209|nr:glutathione S-transferase 1-1-like [Hyposmocoma kahamanoa]
MAIDLYYTPDSPACRLVLLVAAALDLQMEHHHINLQNGDQYDPKYLKINPQHSVPTIVDNGFPVWEARAIGRYLVNKYGMGSTLYPTELKERTLVDMRLDFDLGVLYERFAYYFYPQLFIGERPDKVHFAKLLEAMFFFNTFLAGETYAAGPTLTLADLSLVSTISTIEASGMDLTPFENILEWYTRVKATALKYEETNGKGLEVFKEMVDNWRRNKTEL